MTPVKDVPRPPAGLDAAARATWLECAGRLHSEGRLYRETLPQVAPLAAATQALRRAQAELDRDGMTMQSRSGGRSAHPATRIERGALRDISDLESTFFPAPPEPALDELTAAQFRAELDAVCSLPLDAPAEVVAEVVSLSRLSAAVDPQRPTPKPS